MEFSDREAMIKSGLSSDMTTTQNNAPRNALMLLTDLKRHPMHTTCCAPMVFPSKIPRSSRLKQKARIEDARCWFTRSKLMNRSNRPPRSAVLSHCRCAAPRP